MDDPLMLNPIKEFVSVKVKVMQSKNTFSNYELIKLLEKSYSNSIIFNNKIRYYDFPFENNEQIVKLNKKCKEEIVFLMFSFLKYKFKEEEIIEEIKIYKEVKINIDE